MFQHQISCLNDEENLAEIKREILKVIDYSGESAHLDPPADVNFNKNSVVSTQDPDGGSGTQNN